MKPRKRSGKGFFSGIRLPLAARYLTPASRRRMVVVGLVAALALGGFMVADRLLLKSRFLSNGPLSSSHAAFGGSCGSCHAEAGGGVTNELCSACHEKFGDELGVYTFAAHYLYRSDDFRRVVPSEDETPCFDCHVEHEGREAQITRVSDAHCLTCHEFGAFGEEHPEFRFAAESIPDSGALLFPHAHHVSEVMKEEELEDPERACLYCHNARPDGRSFEAIDFDRHCDSCHLTVTTGTPALAVEAAAGEAGVATLESIVAEAGPGARWALFTDPGEFRQRGSSVSKTPVHHRDPWVLENLRRLRGRLFRDAGLADLLVASADAPDGDLRDLYREAVSTLGEQAAGLRGSDRPEVQAELRQIDALLGQLEHRIEDPYAPLDETRFLLALEERNPDLDDATRTELEGLVDDLTESCRECHTVENATISRVQKDQRVLDRAEFNHRAHIIQRRCLECHAEIPIERGLADPDSVEAAEDRAEIQNLPRIDTCRECHAPRAASDRCVTCHLFHPEQRRSELLLYLE